MGDRTAFPEDVPEVRRVFRGCTVVFNGELHFLAADDDGPLRLINYENDAVTLINPEALGGWSAMFPRRASWVNSARSPLHLSLCRPEREAGTTMDAIVFRRPEGHHLGTRWRVEDHSPTGVECRPLGLQKSDILRCVKQLYTPERCPSLTEALDQVTSGHVRGAVLSRNAALVRVTKKNAALFVGTNCVDTLNTLSMRWATNKGPSFLQSLKIK